QDECGHADGGLDRFGASFAPATAESSHHHPGTLSTGMEADCTIRGVHPGMTLTVCVVTVTDAVAALRWPATVVSFSPVVDLLTYSYAAWIPMPALPCSAAAARAPSCAAASATV